MSFDVVTKNLLRPRESASKNESLIVSLDSQDDKIHEPVSQSGFEDTTAEKGLWKLSVKRVLCYKADSLNQFVVF